MAISPGNHSYNVIITRDDDDCDDDDNNNNSGNTVLGHIVD